MKNVDVESASISIASFQIFIHAFFGAQFNFVFKSVAVLVPVIVFCL